MRTTPFPRSVALVRGRRDGELGERLCAHRARRYAAMNRRRREWPWARRSGTDGRPGSSLAAVLGKTSLPHWPRILAVYGNSGVRVGGDANPRNFGVERRIVCERRRIAGGGGGGGGGYR